MTEQKKQTIFPHGLLISGVVRGVRKDDRDRTYLGFAQYTLDDYGETQIHTEELRLGNDVSKNFLDSILAMKGKHCLLQIERDLGEYNGRYYLRTVISPTANLLEV
jgi:hypothetical protein